MHHLVLVFNTQMPNLIIAFLIYFIAVSNAEEPTEITNNNTKKKVKLYVKKLQNCYCYKIVQLIHYLVQ